MDLLLEAQQLRLKLHTVTGDELLALRLKLRAVIRSLVEVINTSMENDFLEDGPSRVLRAEIHFRNGLKKTIVAIHSRTVDVIGVADKKGRIVYYEFNGYDAKLDLLNLKRQKALRGMLAARNRRGRK